MFSIISTASLAAAISFIALLAILLMSMYMTDNERNITFEGATITFNILVILAWAPSLAIVMVVE